MHLVQSVTPRMVFENRRGNILCGRIFSCGARLWRTLILVTALSIVALGTTFVPASAGSLCRDDGTGDGNFANATGTNATACGFTTFASGNQSTAISEFSVATGSSSTSLGFRASAGGGFFLPGNLFNGFTNANTTAIGAGSQAGALAAGQTNATAVGQGATANAASATALGQGAAATAFNSVAIGQGSVANVDNTVSLGAVGAERRLVNLSAGNITSGSTDAVNAGQLFTANQRVAAAFGGGAGLDVNGQLTAPTYTIQGTNFNNAGGAFTAVNNFITTQTANGAALTSQVTTNTTNITTNTANIATNTSNIATNTSNIALNTSSINTLNGQVATNTTNIATNTANIANINTNGTTYFRSNSTGPAASAVGTNSNAIGASSSATGANSLAFGTGSQATQSGSLAIGFGASSTGTNAIAIGTGSSATGSVAVGSAASAANGGAAFGDGAVATATNSTALGPNASATAANAVAIGSGSTNIVANTVSVGSAGNERRITNVAAGINQTDAVNVGQLQSVASGLQSQIGGLQSQISDNLFETRSGIALALAASGLRYDDRPGKLSMAGAFGGYKGASGLAVGVGYAATDRLRFNASVSGSPSQGSYGGVVGGSFTLN